MNIGCRETEILMAGHVAGKLDPGESERVAAHVRGCPVCSGLQRSVDATLRTVSAVRVEDVPVRPEMLAELLARIEPRARARGRHAAAFSAAAALALVFAGLAMLASPNRDPQSGTRFLPVYVQGEVCAGTGPFERAPAPGLALQTGAVVRTGPGGLIRIRAGEDAEMALLQNGRLSLGSKAPALIEGRMFVRAFRPFSMKAGPCSIEVKGTEFFVSAAPSETVVELVEGSLSITGPGGSAELKPGSRACASRGLPVSVAPTGSAQAPPAFMAPGPLIIEAAGRPGTGGLLAVVLTNVSGSEMWIRGFNPAYPSFALEMQGDSPGRSFVVNLGPFRVRPPGGETGPVRLPPGSSRTELFDTAAMGGLQALRSGETFTATAVYQSSTRGVGFWTGKVSSGPFALALAQDEAGN